MGGYFSEILAKKGSKKSEYNMDYEFNSIKQLSHINMDYNST